MTDKKTSEETAATLPLVGTELLRGVQAGSNVQFTAQDVANLAAAAASNLRNLEFSKVATVVMAMFAPPALNLVTEPFVSNTGQFTRLTEGTAFTTFGVSGTLVATNSSGAAQGDIVQVGSDITMPQIATSIDVTARTNAASGYDFVSVGICKDSNNFIVAAHDRIANSLSVQVKIAGTATFNGSITLALAPVFKLGLSIVGNVACVYTDTGAGWVFRTGYDFTAKINLKAATLTGWKPAFGYASAVNSSITLDNFSAGRFGGFGFRDFSIVTNEDGTPYINSGLVYFTAAMNDGLGTGSQGVLSLNLTTYAVTQVGVLMVSRGGAIQNDGAMHLVRKSDGTFRITATTWGNGFGNAIDVWYGTSSSNLLSGGFVLASLAKLTLPGQAAGYAAYDSFLVLDAATWRLAYTLSENQSFTGNPFYPAVAYSTDLDTWTLDAIDSRARPFEGTKFCIFRGVAFITSSTSGQVRFYDKRLNWRGYINVTTDGLGNTYPHAMIFQTASKTVLLTFDGAKPAGITGSGTWGQMIVHEAAL